MDHWFSADYHLGHANIIEYCGRPFKNIEHMNSEIIRRHNAIVKPEDTVYHLGDFCFKNTLNRGEGLPITAGEYRKQLNGHLIFIRGNHDNNNSCKTIMNKAELELFGWKVLIQHEPTHIDYKYPLILCGHIHEKWLSYCSIFGVSKTILINVGVDRWNFQPISFRTILKTYHKVLKGLKLSQPLVEEVKDDTKNN